MFRIRTNPTRPLPHLALLSAIALIAGCGAVGPDYSRPEIPAPPHWSAPMAGGETEATASLGTWWTSFHDPQLDVLIERAVGANHDLRVAEARVRESRAQYGIASAELYPNADAGAGTSRERTSRHQPVLGSLPIPSTVPFDNTVYQAGFDASWEIDVFGGKRRGEEAALAEVDAAGFSQRGVLLTVLGDVARNYLELRGCQSRIRIAQESIASEEQALAISQDRVANGLTSHLDVEQATTLLATTRSSLPLLDTAQRAAIHRLGVLLGQPPGSLLATLSLPAALPATPPIVPVGLPADLLLRRPDVQRAERQLAAATARIGVAKSDLFPKFFLTGAAGFESISTSDWITSGSSFWSLGPSIQWKIFDAGSVRAHIRVEDARQEQALATYEQTVLIAFEEVENGLTAYANDEQRLRSLEAAVTSSTTALLLARQLYVNGLKDFLSVLEAERSLYQTQDQLASGQQRITTDLVSLYKALGGGWDDAQRDRTTAFAGNERLSP